MYVSHAMTSLESNVSTETLADPLLRDNETQNAPSNVHVKTIIELTPIAFVIVIINALVIVLFVRTKKLRTAANHILLSLAVSDFMTGALNIPLFIIMICTPIVTSTQARFYLNYLLPVVHSCTAISSVYHILLATTEKYLSVVWPITHRRLVKRTTIRRALFTVWFVSIAIAFVPFFWIHKPYPLRNKYLLGHCIFCIVVVFLLPYVFMIYAFAAIFRAIAHGVGQNGAVLRNAARYKKKMRRERKCIILFATMATLFAVCWLPWYITTLLLDLGVYYEPLVHAVVLIRYVTAICNPLLHTFFRPDFRRALRSLVRKCCCVLTRACVESPEIRSSEDSIQMNTRSNRKDDKHCTWLTKLFRRSSQEEGENTDVLHLKVSDNTAS